MRNCHAEHRAHSHIVYVMSVVFAARNGDERGAEQGCECHEDAREVCAGAVDVALASDEEGEISETAKGEAAMTARKATPAVVQNMVVCLGADLECDELMGGRAGRRLASRNEIWAGAPNGILDHIGDEAGENHADHEAKYCNVRLVRPRTNDKRPCDEHSEGDKARIYEKPNDRYALDFGMRVPNRQVVEEKHAVEGLGEELYLCLACEPHQTDGRCRVLDTYQDVSAYQNR